MSFIKVLAMVPLCIAIAACSGGGSSSSSDDSSSSSGSGSGGAESDGSGSGGSSSDAVVGLDMPSQVDVVTASEDTSVSAQLRALDFVKTLRAFNDAGTDYTTDEQFVHTWHPGLEPIDTVNSILCFIAQVKGDEMVGEGAYTALIDDGDCNTGDSSGSSSGSSGDQSSAADNSVSFVEVVAVATREDNDSPMIVQAWIPEMGGGEGEGPEAIKLHIVVSEAPSDTNPNGSFHMSFGFFESADVADASARTGGGELATATSADGRSGFTLYETSEESFGGMGSGTFTQLASVFVEESGNSGDAVTSMSMEFSGGGGPEDFGMGEEFSSFGLSFDENAVLIAEVFDIEDLFDGDAVADLCLSRTDFKQAVWRYDLYWGADSLDHSEGDRVELNSGFPFRFDSNDDGEPDGFGFVGYWGVWADGEQVLADGTEIQRDTFGGPGVDGEQAEPEVYTVQTTGGRLIKNVVETLSLTELDGVQFFFWDDTLWDPDSEVAYDQWVVEYLLSTDSRASGGAGWYKIGGISFGGGGGGEPEGDGEGGGEGEEEGSDEMDEGSEENFGGPQMETLDTAVKVTFNFEGERLFMFSDQLGGGVEFQQGADEITFFREEFVDGTQDEFSSASSINLVCYEQCLIGTLTLDDLQTFEGPYLGFNHEEIFIDDGFVPCEPGDDECESDFGCEGDCPEGDEFSGEPPMDECAPEDECDDPLFSDDFIELIVDDFEIVTFDYSFSVTGDNALTLVRTENGEPVTIDSSVTQEQLMSTPHSWGLHSGRMISADTADTLQFMFPWEIYDSNRVTVFYTWETGLEQWNRLTVVRDSEGDVAQFDKPVDFVYEHSNANDRSPADTDSGETNEFDGQTFMISYGGQGDLWGIPFANVGDGRWYPLFNVADGVAMGAMDEYVIKAREIEQKMEQLEDGCTGLSLDNLVVPPTDFTEDYDIDIGAMPEVDGAPSVVGGVVQTAEESG